MTTVKHHAGEQAVTSDVEEHEREHAIAHTLRLIQQNQHDCNLNNLLDEFHRQHLFPSPHGCQRAADTTATQLVVLTEHQAVVSMLLDLQGSAPKSMPAPSGLFIPKPLHVDFTRDFLPQSATSNGLSGDMQALQAARPTAWQPQFTWQGR